MREGYHEAIEINLPDLVMSQVDPAKSIEAKATERGEAGSSRREEKLLWERSRSSIVEENVVSAGTKRKRPELSS